VDGDGDPDFWKHNGVYFGITDEGDYKVDTTHGNDGTLDSEGKEADPSTDGTSGNQYYDLPQDSEHFVRLNDVSDPLALTPVTTMQLKKALREIIIGDAAGIWKLLIDGGVTLVVDGKDANATMTVGDGAKHLAIVEALQALWGVLVTYLDGHTHGPGSFSTPVGTGGGGGSVTGTSDAPDQSASTWDNNINSTKVAIPNG
jgi:hypothetical protein